MSSPHYRVLVVDDEENHFLMLRELFSLAEDGVYLLEWASSYEAAIESVPIRKYDAYLLDYRLGRRTGIDLMRDMAAHGCRGPMILFTGYGDRELAVAAMKAGAMDYLVKGEISATLLDRTIRYAIERRAAEERLKASQEYARNVVQCSMDMIVATDRDLRITEFNPSAEEGFGYPRLDVLSKPLALLFADPADLEKVSKEVSERQRSVREVLAMRKNGERFPTMLAASPLRDAEGAFIGFTGNWRDITDQKRAEQALKRAREELEQKVQERTSALTSEILERKLLADEHEKLILHLQDALDKLNRLKGIIPICSSCKRIRDEAGAWHQLEAFIQSHSDTRFSHGFCPECSRNFQSSLKQLESLKPPATRGE